MSRKKRIQNQREAKDRRMKKFAVGGAVLFVAVLAFEVPKMLGGSKASAPASTTATTTPDATAPSTATPAATPATTPQGTAVAVAAAPPTTGSTKLPNSDVAPKRAKSQLESFSNFSGKDPFAQQLSTGTQLPTPTSSSTSTPPPTAQQAASVTSRAGQQSSSQPSTRTLAKTGAATISVNGRRETVQIGAGFPSSNPLFRLVSVSHGVVRVGIAGGSYSSGAQTVSLVTGRTLTLVDTADGIHYKLRLLAAA